MSVSLWAYKESCDGRRCCGDCDYCSHRPEEDDEDESEFVVEISPRYNDSLPTIHENFMSESAAKLYVDVFNKHNTVYKAEYYEVIN